MPPCFSEQQHAVPLAGTIDALVNFDLLDGRVPVSGRAVRAQKAERVKLEPPTSRPDFRFAHGRCLMSATLLKPTRIGDRRPGLSAVACSGGGLLGAVYPLTDVPDGQELQCNFVADGRPRDRAWAFPRWPHDQGALRPERRAALP